MTIADPADHIASGSAKKQFSWSSVGCRRMFPQLSIELLVNDPSYSDAQHQRLEETMRLARFPACFSQEALAHMKDPTRLPECLRRQLQRHVFRVYLCRAIIRYCVRAAMRFDSDGGGRNGGRRDGIPAFAFAGAC